MATSNSNVVLVEKHFIPVDVYQQMYGPITTRVSVSSGGSNSTGATRSTARMSNTTSSATSAAGSNLFQTVIENFFPRSSQIGGDSRRIRPDPPTSAAGRTMPNSSSNVTSNTRRVFVSDVFTDTTTDPSSLFLYTTLLRAMSGEQGDGAARGLSASEITRNSETYEIGGEYPYISRSGSLTCSICTSEYERGDDVRRLNRCQHEFHETCIDTWLGSHNTCPVCRSEIVSNVDNVD